MFSPRLMQCYQLHNCPPVAASISASGRRRKGNREGENEEGKRGERGEKRRVDRELERKEPGKRCSVALECLERK